MNDNNEKSVNETIGSLLSEKKEGVEQNDTFSRESEMEDFAKTLSEINFELAKELEEENEDLLDDCSAEGLGVEKYLIYDEKEEINIEKPQKKCNKKQTEQENKPNGEVKSQPKDLKKAVGNEVTKEEKITTAKSVANNASAGEYIEYKITRFLSRINYDLANPTLTSAQIKSRMDDCSVYFFNSVMVLSSKLNSVKRAVKNSGNVCSVIGYNTGEVSALAKRWEIRQAKWAKAKSVMIFTPLSCVCENKRRLLTRELKRLKKTCGKALKLWLAVDTATFSLEQFELFLRCAVEAKADAVCLYNDNGKGSNYAVKAAKMCAEKCEVYTYAKVNYSSQMTEYFNVGVSGFCVNNAVALAEQIKHEDC
ncbi:MAG: hypothetical protein IJW13_01495 [Clostridia bacterium]|nr:hypothetical protein [Clostridia bacterium]